MYIGEMVGEYLKENGYDGLVSNDSECDCKENCGWHEMNYRELQDYLHNLTRWDFENGVMVKAVTAVDVEWFGREKYKDLPLNQFVNYGEQILTDALGNDLSMITVTRKKHKLPNGKKINGRLIGTLIYDCHATYGTAINGCWVVPELGK